ncbi:MAG: ribonuclease P protein component [Bacteroidales bacterium]|nr:ribonuclease P protein component [Bacteroidales bacterium]
MEKERFTFGKNDRLKGVKSVALLFGDGKTFFSYPFRIVWNFTLAHPEIASRTGISVPKREFKRAVDRNRIKRIFRESWRHRKKRLDVLISEHNKEIDIMFIYTGREIPSLSSMDGYIDKAMAKFSLILKPELKEDGNPENISPRTKGDK